MGCTVLCIAGGASEGVKRVNAAFNVGMGSLLPSVITGHLFAFLLLERPFSLTTSQSVNQPALRRTSIKIPESSCHSLPDFVN